MTADLHKASLRHATHYLQTLGRADELYLKGGDSLSVGLKLFDEEWQNIQSGQTWAERFASENSDAARCCSAYANAGAAIFGFRLHPHELLHWLRSALAVARQYRDQSSEAVHLANLGFAHSSLGETQR